MTPNEIRLFEKLVNTLQDMQGTLKTIQDNEKKANSNTNKNTMTYKIVEAVEKVSKSIDSLKAEMKDSTEKLSGQIKELTEEIASIKK